MSSSSRTQIALAFACLWLPACKPAPSGPPGRGVLVIAIDALRYDHLGIHGYDRDTSPGFDALAREGVRFRHAYAAAPWQVPAHMALLSASDPRIARRMLPPTVPSNQAILWHLPEDAPHPAAQFLSAGFRTAAFYDHPNLAPVYGYEPGFEVYQGPREDADAASSDYGSSAVIRRFDQWLTQGPQSRDWFAYLEFSDLERVWQAPDPRWDTHYPARPELSRVPPVGDAGRVFFALPRSKWSQGMSTLGEYESRYDGAIRELDGEFRKLRTRLEQLGRWADTTVVVVGAYGLSFGESGLLLDSGTLSDVDLHVPLIVRPGRGINMRPGLDSEALVSTIDVLPTLLDVSRVDAAGGMDGVSFARVLSGEDRRARRWVHASCAFQEGFATIDRTYCYERTWPGRTQDARLAESWFGDGERRPDLVREVLHDHRVAGSQGHVFGPSADLANGKALIEAGEAWALQVEARRARLQGEAPAAPAAPAVRR